MRASDIMTTKVTTVSPATSVRRAAGIMLERNVSGLPVVGDDGRLAGIVTEGDLMRRAELGAILARGGELPAEERARAYVKGHGWSVGDVMTREVVTIAEDMPAGRVAALMEERGVKRLPVARDGRLVGIVSRADLLRAIATARLDATASGDAAIRRSVLTRLCEDVGLDGDRIAVTAADGFVHLWGSVGSEAEREAARVAAECVRGVKGVHVHMRMLPGPAGDGTVQAAGGEESGS